MDFRHYGAFAEMDHHVLLNQFLPVVWFYTGKAEMQGSGRKAPPHCQQYLQPCHVLGYYLSSGSPFKPSTEASVKVMQRKWWKYQSWLQHKALSKMRSKQLCTNSK